MFLFLNDQSCCTICKHREITLRHKVWCQTGMRANMEVLYWIARHREIDYRGSYTRYRNLFVTVESFWVPYNSTTTLQPASLLSHRPLVVINIESLLLAFLCTAGTFTLYAAPWEPKPGFILYTLSMNNFKHLFKCYRQYRHMGMVATTTISLFRFILFYLFIFFGMEGGFWRPQYNKWQLGQH